MFCPCCHFSKSLPLSGFRAPLGVVDTLPSIGRANYDRSRSKKVALFGGGHTRPRAPAVPAWAATAQAGRVVQWRRWAGGPSWEDPPRAPAADTWVTDHWQLLPPPPPLFGLCGPQRPEEGGRFELAGRTHVSNNLKKNPMKYKYINMQKI